MTSPDGAVPAGGYVGASGASNNISSLASITQASAQSIMSGGVLNAYNGAALNTTGFVKAAGDEGMASLCRAVAGINILGIEPFQFLNGWADNLDQQAQQALTTGNTALSTANSAVTSITTQQTQASTGGNSVTVTSFPPGLSGSIGTTSSWSLSATTGASSMVQWVTDANGNAGPATIGSPTGNHANWLTAVNGQAMATDNHQATTVVGVAQATGNVAASGLIVRGTTNLSTFVCAIIDQSQVALGYGTLSAGTITLNIWKTVNCTIAAGDTVQLTAVGTVYTINVNGSPVTSYSDSGVQSPVGSANRSAGMLTEQYVQSSGLGGTSVQLGWSMSSFNAGDTSSPPVVGTGWTLYQASSTAVALPGSGGWSTLGSGTFDSQQVNPNKVTVTTLGTGQITIPTSGWYSVAVSVTMTSACGSSNVFQVGVYKTPSGGSRSLVMTGNQVSGSTVYQVAAAGVIFCTQGDIIQPAVYQAGTNSVVGNGTPNETYFSGTLCSFN